MSHYVFRFSNPTFEKKTRKKKKKKKKKKKNLEFFWMIFNFSLLKLLKEIKRHFCYTERIKTIEMRNTLLQSFDVSAYFFQPLCYKLWLLYFPKLAQRSQLEETDHKYSYHV